MGFESLPGSSDRECPVRRARLSGMTELLQVEPTAPAARPLLDALDVEYRALYGLVGEIDHHAPAEFRPPDGVFLLAVAGAETVAGGAIRRWSDGIAEIKRMWTHPAHRRRGHAARVLASLERAAAGLGYHAVRLETGSLQEGALALYAAAGYRRIPAYGRYAGHPHCLSFEKAV